MEYAYVGVSVPREALHFFRDVWLTRKSGSEYSSNFSSGVFRTTLLWQMKKYHFSRTERSESAINIPMIVGKSKQNLRLYKFF